MEHLIRALAISDGLGNNIGADIGHPYSGARHYRFLGIGDCADDAAICVLSGDRQGKKQNRRQNGKYRRLQSR